MATMIKSLKQALNFFLLRAARDVPRCFALRHGLDCVKVAKKKVSPALLASFLPMRPAAIKALRECVGFDLLPQTAGTCDVGRDRAPLIQVGRGLNHVGGVRVSLNREFECARSRVELTDRDDNGIYRQGDRPRDLRSARGVRKRGQGVVTPRGKVVSIGVNREYDVGGCASR